MMKLPQPVLHALTLLGDAGFEAYVVGGAVRDTLLQRTPKDYDIATDASPEETGRIFAAYRVIGTGLAHGTVTVRIDHMPLEITTYRVGYTKGADTEKARTEEADVKEACAKEACAEEACAKEACAEEAGAEEAGAKEAGKEEAAIEEVCAKETRPEEAGIEWANAEKAATETAPAKEGDTQTKTAQTKTAQTNSGISRGLWADLACRDFTCNALAYHPRTGLIDPLGGAQDLANGIVRCPGTPALRFGEDALRILRALRFAAVFGMRIEPQTAQALRENRLLLQTSAAERVREELTQLLCGASAAGVLEEYAEVVAVVLPELVPMFSFEQKNPHHDKDIWHHTLAVVAAAPAEPVLRWAALLHDIGKPACFSLGADGVGHFYGHPGQSAQLADAILTRLRFDTHRRERIVRLVRRHDTPVLPEEKQLKRLLNKLGEEDTRRLLALQKADTCGQAPMCFERLPLLEEAGRLLDDLLREKACFSLRDLAINGNDLLRLGMQGRAVGAALDACLSAVLDGQIPNERAALLQYIRGESGLPV